MADDVWQHGVASHEACNPVKTTPGPALHTSSNACQHSKYTHRPDDENPLVFYGNWETPDGKRFFCK